MLVDRFSLSLNQGTLDTFLHRGKMLKGRMESICLHEPLAQSPEAGLNFSEYKKDIITGIQHLSHPAVVKRKVPLLPLPLVAY